MLRRFFIDTLELLIEVGSRLGLLRGGAEWQRERLRRRLERLEDERETVARSVRAKHRMCRECGALNASSAGACERCGASMQGVPRGGLGRLATLVLPTFGSVSMTIVGLLVTVYVACAAAGAPGSFFDLPGQLLYRLGAMVPFRYADFAWSRLLTAVFLHGSVTHIAFNAYALSILGPRVEDEIGARRFLVVFVTTGFLSFLGSALVNDSLSVGASGSLFGLIGFGLVYAHLSGDRMLRADMGRWALIGFLLIPLIGFAFGMHPDHAAHVAGFLAGVALGALVRGPRARVSSGLERLWGLGATAAALLPVAAFGLAVLRALAET